jgi:hypothetical protein
MGNIGVGDSAWNLGGACGGSSTNLWVCVSGGLALSGGVGLGDLALFSAGSCFGQCGNLGPARSF